MKSNDGDALDQSIHRLLDEIGERRKQAAHLAQLVEQSIYQPQSMSRNVYQSHSPPVIDNTPPVLIDSSIDGSVVDCQPSSASPPASFLEDFTRAFVDSYKPPHSLADGLQMSDLQVYRPNRMVLPICSRSPKQPSMAYFPTSDKSPVLGIMSAHEAGGNSSGHALELPHLGNPLLEPVCGESECGLDPDQNAECRSKPKAEQQQNISTEQELCGMSVIDREARVRMWQRVSANRPPSQISGDHDEAHIKAIVQLAEQFSAIQTQHVGENSLAPPGGSQDNILPQTLSQTDLSDRGPVLTPPTTVDSHFLARWSESEWERWAEYVQHKQTVSGIVDRDQMLQRLEWVHEQQTDVWKHGFSDSMLASGKLRRIYQGITLDLQAYPDGNVKRTAAITDTRYHHTNYIAKTLYFANGDWTCTLSSCQKGINDETFYYYSEERVWHEQKGDNALYKYPDGREERIDAQGTVTVTHPSGDVRVSLGVLQQ